MPREPELFNATNGDVIGAYFLARKGGFNIPESWIERSRTGRKARQAELGKLLKAGKLGAMDIIQDWHVAYKKECFYQGLRILLELERKGKAID